MSNKNLKIFHTFPKPKKEFDNWQALKVRRLTLENIELLFATGSLTNYKSSRGAFYFKIDPLMVKIADPLSPNHPTLKARKAYICFQPINKKYELKKWIVNASADVMEARNKMKSFIAARMNIEDNPNKIPPKYLCPVLTDILKNDIIYLFDNLKKLLELELTKKGAKRACWQADKGYYYVGLCEPDYQYPPEGF